MVGSTRASSSSRSTVRGVAGLGALDAEPGAQPLDQLLGRGDADVGGEQGVLDRLPGVLVEAVAREQRQQAAAQAALGAGEALAQPDQAGRGAFGPLERRGLAARAPAAGQGRSGGASTSASVGGAGERRRCRHPRGGASTRPRRPEASSADENGHAENGDADDQIDPVTHAAIQPEGRQVGRGAGASRGRPGRSGRDLAGSLSSVGSRRRRLRHRVAEPRTARARPRPRCGKATYVTTRPDRTRIASMASDDEEHGGILRDGGADAPRVARPLRAYPTSRRAAQPVARSGARSSGSTAARIASGIGVTGRARVGVVDVHVHEAALGGRLVAVALEQPDPVDHRGADLVDDQAGLDRRREADLAEVAAARSRRPPRSAAARGCRARWPRRGGR